MGKMSKIGIIMLIAILLTVMSCGEKPSIKEESGYNTMMFYEDDLECD